MRISVSILVPMMWPTEAMKKLAAASTRRRNKYSAPILRTTPTVREAKSLMPALVTYRTSMGSTSSHTVVRAAQNKSKKSTALYLAKYGMNLRISPLGRLVFFVCKIPPQIIS